MANIEINERSFDYGPQRGSWVVMVQIEDLRDAAETQLKYHEDRLRIWKLRLTKARNAEIKSMRATNQQVTGGIQTMFQADVLATQRKALAEQKVSEHQRSFDVFREWYAILSYHLKHDRTIVAKDTLPCTFDDVQFFKLSGYTPAEGR